MTEPSANVILDSISPDGVRLTTMEVVMHRLVLAEFNTHKVFSRNSESSRAVPVEMRINRGAQDPANPVFWAAERPGMQAVEELVDLDKSDAVKLFCDIQDATLDLICNYLSQHPEKGTRLHKSLLNRPMEWFMWHTVICTSTDWTNFFNLRCHPDAQPEMRSAAEAMKKAFEKSVPRFCNFGEWHMPYIHSADWGLLNVPPETPTDVFLGELGKISAARCARISYLTHDGKRDLEKDLELFDKLVTAGHWSPLEHVATPCDGHLASHLGNFRGWDQLRHDYAGDLRG